MAMQSVSETSRYRIAPHHCHQWFAHAGRRATRRRLSGERGAYLGLPSSTQVIGGVNLPYFPWKLFAPYFRRLGRTSSKFGRRAHENSEDNSRRPIGYGHFFARPGRRPDLGVPLSAGGGGRDDAAVPGPAQLLAHCKVVGSPRGQRKRATAPRSARAPAE